MSSPGDRHELEPDAWQREALEQRVFRKEYHHELGPVDYRSTIRDTRRWEDRLRDELEELGPVDYAPRWVDALCWLGIVAGAAFGWWAGPALVGWWFRR